MGRGLGWQGDHRGSPFPCCLQDGDLLRSGWDPATLRLAGMLPQWAQGQHRDARNENNHLTAQWLLHQGRSTVLCWPGWDGGHNTWEVSMLPTTMERRDLHHPYLCCTGTEPT